VIDQLICFI